MNVSKTLAISCFVLSGMFVAGIFYGGKIHCLTMVVMYGFLLLAMLQILLCLTIIFFSRR